MKNLTYRHSQVFGFHLALVWCEGNWRHISLLSEPIGKLMNTTVYVFTNSVLSLGFKLKTDKYIKHFVQRTVYRELYDFAGDPVQFDWRIYLAHTTTKILQDI